MNRSRTQIYLRTILIAGLALAATSTASSRAAEPPKLVVVVSVDQLCYEYLVRFRGGFAPDGLFLRVEKEGASYVNCHHRHAFTVTAPGHAVQLTGAYADTGGIVGNNWFDRTTGKTVYCVFDAAEQLVGMPPAPRQPAEETKPAETKPADAKEKEKEEEELTGISPRNLLVNTVGDMLKLSTGGKAKVYGVALKDRAAVLMTGHSANAAFWYEGKSGRWVTSTYYAKELPGYVRAVNEGNAISQFGGKEWNLLLGREAYQHYHPDDYAEERDAEGMGKTFPHKFAAAGDPKLPRQVGLSPFGNEMTLHVAGQVLVHEELGQDDVPDILAINLSSNDFVGHAYGPHSLEVQDITYRTDRQLGEFARFVEKQLAGRPWVLALTADHGVAPLVQYAKERGLPAMRNPLGDLKVLQAKLEAHLLAELLAPELGAHEKPLVQKLSENQVYLQQDHPVLAGESFALAQKFTREFLLRQPAVFGAVTREQLLSGGGEGKLFHQFRRAFHPRRSGDVLFVLAPYSLPGTNGTTHGSPWQYDTHVPLLLMGPGIKPGRFERPTSPAALAATISRLLQIEPPPACVEEPLGEALRAK